jgi:hypothetical protein
VIQDRVAKGSAIGCARPGCHNLFKRVTCRKFCSAECGAKIRVEGRDKPCSVDGCGRFADRAGYCGAHYRRLRDGRPMDDPIKPKVLGGAPCSVEDCPNKATRKGMCPTHDYRRRNGNPLDVPVRQQRPNEPIIAPDGYVRIHVPGIGRIHEHRMVMEAVLGRELRPFENVHHINGVRHDNRPENLELWCKPQPPGQRVEDLVAWVVECYPNEIAAVVTGEGWSHMELLR